MKINSVLQTSTQNISYTVDVNNSNDDEDIKPVYKTGSITQEDLDKALKKLNKFLEDEKTHAEYSVHKDLGAIMIKIIDDNTEDVIMEIPPEKILDMISSMCKQFGIFDKKA